MKKKGRLVNVAMLLLSLAVALVIGEVGFRAILFTDLPLFESLRNPGNYADYFSEDDFWKLSYLFGHKPRSRMHPLLGWVGEFSPDTYLHNEAEILDGRRPVLLYGDSFAGCSNDALCFDDILNGDVKFAENHYLLNYGVGSYGTDQIFLLFQNSVDLYDDPFVVISFMTLDMDRSILSVRSGPKPYYRIENDLLSLKGVPIATDPKAFYDANPPQIRSYVFRRILYGYMPEAILQTVRNDDERTNEKKEINEKLIVETVNELRSRGLDFVFLIFHPHWPGITTIDGESDWRDPFIRQVLEDIDVPYIWTKGLVSQSEGTILDIEQYFLEDGHPTTHFNTLIAGQIEHHVLGND
jgi:hypothetical protein